MAWGDQQDYWWLGPKKGDSGRQLQAMQLGAQIKQQLIQNALKQQDQQLEAKRTGIQIQEYFSKKELQNSMMEGSSVMAKTLAGFKDQSDPNIPEVIYGVMAKYRGLDELGLQYLDDHRKSVEFKGRQDELKEARLLRGRIAEDKLFGVFGDKQTAVMTNLRAADNAEEEALKIEASDPSRAESLRKNAALLRSTVTAPTETIESYTDTDGKQQFKITRGPATEKKPSDLSVPTTATTSQIQQRMLAAEKGAELGASLMATLTDADVGVRGNVNQVVINEGLAQLIPGLQKGQVTEARTMLGQWKENALKAIASDTRISDKDRAALEKSLPSLGAIESVQSAKDKIKVFMDRYREQTRIDATAAKIPIPNWALNVTELREKVKAGGLSEDEAVKILVRYH